MSVLAGKTVLVTRAAHQAESWIRMLEADGATVWRMPAVRIEPVEDASIPEGPFDWVVLTSPNAARWVGSRVPLEAKCLAVGPATARALREAGGAEAALAPEPFLGVAIPKALPGLAGRTVWLPRGDLAGPELPEALRALGAWVVETVCYRTVHETEVPSDLSVEPPDYLTFTSPSCFRGAQALLEDSGRGAWLRGPWRVSLGPVTAEAMREAGFPAHAEASPSTLEALLESMRRLAAQEETRCSNA